MPYAVAAVVALLLAIIGFELNRRNGTPVGRNLLYVLTGVIAAFLGAWIATR